MPRCARRRRTCVPAAAVARRGQPQPTAAAAASRDSEQRLAAAALGAAVRPLTLTPVTPVTLPLPPLRGAG